MAQYPPKHIYSGSRDNTLFIDGQLRGYNAGPTTELVVICIYEELV
eukprot:COSAG06_NODE_54623_length_293_cov_1.371134_1_plen_45_part_01